MQDITVFNNEIMQAAQGIAATGIFSVEWQDDDEQYNAVANAVCSALINKLNLEYNNTDEHDNLMQALRDDLDYLVNKECFELDY